MIFAKLDLEQIHAYTEKGTLTLRHDGMIFDSISQAYPAPARSKDRIRDVLFPPRKPGWLLEELIADWSLRALHGDSMAFGLYLCATREADYFATMVAGRIRRELTQHLAAKESTS
jgi:hypothetical protein